LKIGNGVDPWNDLNRVLKAITSNVQAYLFPGGTLVNDEAAISISNASIANTDLTYAIGTNFDTTSFVNPTNTTNLTVTYSG